MSAFQTPSPDEAPRRLDPRTILVKALPGLPSAIFAVPILLASWRGGSLTLAVALTALLAGLAVLMGMALIVAWVRWRMFTYQVLPDQLVISRGIFNRTRRSIPVQRIQDVSIKQRLLARLIGLAEVCIETGGGEKDEGQLDSVSLAEACRLRDLLRGLNRPCDEPEVSTSLSLAATGPMLFRLTSRRLLYFGLFNFSLLWIAAIFGVGQYFGQALDLDGDRWLDIWGMAGRELLSRLSPAFILGATAVAAGLGMIAGVIRTVLQFHDFRLTFADGRFRYSRGLLTRREVVVARRQIQLGLVEWGALSGRLGWCALKVQTLGGSDHVSGRLELAPFARASEIQPLIALAGLAPFDPSGLTPVSAWHTRSALIRLVAIPAFAVAVAAILFPLAGLLLLALPLPVAVALLRRGHHRYGLAETGLMVRRGVLKQREWTVPYGNIQSVTIRQGPMQRRAGIASVRIDTAGGTGLNGPHIHDLPQDDATDLVREVMNRVEAARALAGGRPALVSEPRIIAGQTCGPCRCHNCTECLVWPEAGGVAGPEAALRHRCRHRARLGLIPPEPPEACGALPAGPGPSHGCRCGCDRRQHPAPIGPAEPPVRRSCRLSPVSCGRRSPQASNDGGRSPASAS